MDNINDSVEQLKSVYKAQTEAYVEFNTALITILSRQKEILNKVESLQIFSEEEFKKLSANHTHLEKLFSNFQTSQNRRDNKYDANCDNVKTSINSFIEDIDNISKEIKSIKTLQWEFKNSWNKLLWILGGIMMFLTLVQLITGKGIIDWFK